MYQKICFAETDFTWGLALLRSVKDALPGASIDTSLLNRFAGVRDVDVRRTSGQNFHVVALDSHTGKVVTHSRYEPIYLDGYKPPDPGYKPTSRRVHGKAGPVPESVFVDLCRHGRDGMMVDRQNHKAMDLAEADRPRELCPIMAECGG